MEINEYVQIAVKLVVLPLIIILGKYLVTVFKTWVDSKTVDMDDKVTKSYIDDICDIISQAVMCTTQTYVSTLKAQGAFTEEAQKIAFSKTKEAVLLLLSQEAKEFIAEMYGDLDLWLDSKIEQKVLETK